MLTEDADALSSDSEDFSETNNLLGPGLDSPPGTRKKAQKQERKLRKKKRKAIKKLRKDEYKEDTERTRDGPRRDDDQAGSATIDEEQLRSDRSCAACCCRGIVALLCVLSTITVLAFGVAVIWTADPGQGSQLALRSWASGVHARDAGDAYAPASHPWVKRVGSRTESGVRSGVAFISQSAESMMGEGHPELWISFAFLIAGFVQGIAGFGCGMTAMAIIPAKGTVSLVDTVPIVAVFNGVVFLIILCQMRDVVRKEAVRKVLPLLVVGQLIGVPIGVRLLVMLDPSWLRLLLGVAMLMFVAHKLCEDEEEDREHAEINEDALELQELHTLTEAATDDLTAALARDIENEHITELRGNEKPANMVPGEHEDNASAISKPLSLIWGFPFGIASGVLSGALNEGGPPVVVYLALRGLAKDETKAALQAYFLSMSIYTLPLLWLSGLLQTRHLYYDAIGMPAVLCGIWAGSTIYIRFDATQFARLIVLALGVAGTIYIVDSSLELFEHIGEEDAA